MTLVALLALTTHAWADDQSETIATATNEQVTYTGEHFTITGQWADPDGLWITGSNGNTGDSPNTVTISSKNGEYITRIEAVIGFVVGWGNTKLASTPGDATGTYAQGQTITISSVNATEVTLSSPNANSNMIEIKSWTIYYGPAPTPVPINWNATAKTASIAAMPAGNVTVKVNYYPQATADGAVTAATGAIVSTDAPLVTIDADKLTGADGMMYYVSETSTAPDYTTDGWTTDVPNAKNYTEAKTLYLWYYPLGRVGLTADDIYSDGNMNAEPLELSVAPVPTYNVYFAENADPNHWKAQPDKNVKQGQKVTVTYTGPRRVMGVNVEKWQQPTITIGDQVYSLMPGETWKHLNERLSLGWNIWNLYDDNYYVVVYNYQQISVSSDGNNWQTLEFRIDSPIDTNKQYKWEDAGD